MGKITGFLEVERKENSKRQPKDRIRDFNEFYISLSDEERRAQASKCMNCGVPFCQSGMKLSGMVVGCPLHNLIPEWNDELYLGHDRQAYERLAKANNFPEFTGRVCPALCEKACMCGQYDTPVTVHDNEKYLIETTFKNGYITPRILKVRSGKKVAVVGSGPSGLAVADELNHRGHLVTVFEREDRIGGLLMYGIPNMKLDKSVITRRQELMEAEGVIFRTGCDIGSKEFPAEKLKKEFDVVVLCCGAKKPRELPAAYADAGEKGKKGKNLVDGAYYAVDFLTRVTKELLGSNDKNVPAIEGKNVIVVGGGDTGNDCIGTVIRKKCRSVTALEMMPKPPIERLASNPWPEWPKVLKTDYGHEEAIECFGSDPRVFETTVKKVITDKKGKLTGVVTVKLDWSAGKPTEIEGSEQELPCELLLIAAGFTGCETYVTEQFGVELTARGVAATENADSYATNTAKVFTAGDMHRGQSLVVWAIAEGRACAREVDAYLTGYER